MENQSIAHFVAALQRNISECNFTVKCECTKDISAAEIFLRSQFIWGLKDDRIREQLLQSNVTTFKEIQEKATCLEGTKLENQILTKKSIEELSNGTINKITRKNDSNKHVRPRSKSPGVQKSFHSSSKNYLGNSTIDYTRLGIENLCLRCSRNNHCAPDCRTNRSTLKCRLCQKVGHVSKVCISSLMSRKTGKNQTNSSENYVSEEFQIDNDSVDHTYGMDHINIFNLLASTLDADHHCSHQSISSYI